MILDGRFVLNRPNLQSVLPPESGETQNVRWSTLVDIVRHRGATQPNRLGFTFLKDGEDETSYLTFGELDYRATAAGAALRARGVTGGRVLLLYPQGLEFIVGFFAALYAGAVAVPSPAANAGRAARARILSVVADADVSIALAPPEMLGKVREILDDVEGADGVVASIPVTSLETLESENTDPAPPPRIDPQDTALLQYTSGSTGAPKGVMVSHANIMHNQALIQTRFEHDENTVFVGWLPLFHDMGLIGNLLQPVFVGCSCVLMSPVAFLEEPVRWLRAITKYKGTTAGAPNFAYDLCVDRIRDGQDEGLELSSWDIAYNGSEPVSANTLARFTQRFAPHGFRREAMYPCYGMAESTLLIAGPDKASLPTIRMDATAESHTRQPLVGCGTTENAHDFRIVDPDTHHEMPPRVVGEIWISGGSVAQGYWQRPEETEACFRAQIVGPQPQSETRYLRSGDLGYIDDGELFVTGRIKDVIIVRGKNHYPQDIEATAQASHSGLKQYCSAAFMVTRGDQEKLVVLHELHISAVQNPPVDDIARSVRQAVNTAHGLYVAAVVLVKPASIPKTSSGKIQRRLSRKLFLDGEMSIVAESCHGPSLQSSRTEPKATYQTN